MKKELRSYKNKITNLNEKDEYIALDIFRILFAIGVVAIHVDILSDIGDVQRFYANEVVLRVSVPFFFLTSGFFFGKKINSKKYVVDQCLKLYRLYIFYYLFHLGGLINYIKISENPIKDLIIEILIFIFQGRYQTWFFLALITGSIFLYILVVKLRINYKQLAMTAIIFYVIGTLTNAYMPKRLITIINNYSLSGFAYNTIYACGRNGITYGFPYLAVGYLISNNKEKIRSSSYLKFSLPFMALSILEAIFIRFFINSSGQDMLFFIAPTSICLFLNILLISLDKKFKSFGVMCRKISVIIFGLHLFIIGYATRIDIIPSISTTISLLINTSVICIIVGYVLFLLSNLKGFKFINKIFW